MVKGEPIRVEVGFSGGQVMVAQMVKEEYEALVKALPKGEGWHELEIEDGQATIDLGKVSYVKSDVDESQIGF